MLLTLTFVSAEMPVFWEIKPTWHISSLRRDFFMLRGAVLLKAILGGAVLPWLIEEAEMEVLVASEAAISE